MREYDHYPRDYRLKFQHGKLADIGAAKSDAERDFAEWAKKARLDATQRLNKTRIGTAAEESRKVAEELRISRMTEVARTSGNANEQATDLTFRANLLYGAGNLDEAFVLARAASELGDHERAAEIIESVSFTRTLADPEKAQALHDLGDVDTVEAAFKRDVTHAVAKAYQEGSKLASTLGDVETETRLRREASEIERTAKVAAWNASVKEGVPFSAPVGDNTLTKSELYDLQRRADPRSARQDDFEARSVQRPIVAPDGGEA
jgi:hypothetical protein